MSRMTKAARFITDAPTEDEQFEPGTAPAREASPRPSSTRDSDALLSSTPPPFSIDEAPVAVPAASSDPGRLRALLDRAGDPMPARTWTARGASSGGRRSAARWRHDPNPLGQIAVVLVVLALVVACAAVGFGLLR